MYVAAAVVEVKKVEVLTEIELGRSGDLDKGSNGWSGFAVVKEGRDRRDSNVVLRIARAICLGR